MDIDWNKIPEQATIDKTMTALLVRNFNPVMVANKNEALEKIEQIIPSGSDVMNGSSLTLEEIGFFRLLTGSEKQWTYWKDKILAERIPERRLEVSHTSITASYFLGSVQAIAENGLIVSADATGSRQAAYIYGARHLIWVVGVNKIVSTLDLAMRRLYEYCVPQESARVKKAGGPGTTIGKMVIYEREAQPQRIFTILVKERLGI